MAENVIEIKNLVKSYKMYSRKIHKLEEIIFPWKKKHTTFTAVNDINLNIKQGEIVGILGRNGAGKSTLLKMITGVVVPTEGEIKVEGKISSLLELGAAFNPDLNGVDNIYQHGQVMGLSVEEIDAKKQEIIDFADIGDHLYQPVKTYSSGMFARLAFACAINVNPDILIVDEVLSVGDMAFQHKCFQKFEQFKEQGKTILFVSHSVSDIIRNCTRGIILANGTKIYDGEVKEAVDRYKKLIAGIDIDKNDKEVTLKSIKPTGKTWKENFVTNDNMLDYGDGAASIIDYGIFDTKGDILPALDNSTECVVKMKVRFNTDVTDPIFALSVKDFRGLELCGANTEVNKVVTGNFKKGDIAIAEFKQVFSLAPNKYTLSFGCTRYLENGNLEVLDRKYEVLFLELSANRHVLGLVDLNSDIKVIAGDNNED